MLTKRGCCCEHHGNLCDPMCTACGGVGFLADGVGRSPDPAGASSRLPRYGTITDDNGTWDVVLYGTFLVASDPACAFSAAFGCSCVWPAPGVLCVSGDVPYTYVIACDGPDIAVAMKAYVSDCGDFPPPVTGSGYGYGYTDDPGGGPGSGLVAFGPLAEGSATPTCDGDTLTAEVSFAIPSALTAIPSTSARVTLNLQPIRPQVCCLPCPIVEEDLVLTIGTGSPNAMTFDAASEKWKYVSGATTVTLACTGGHAALTGSGPLLSCSLVSFSCRPLHLDFLCGGTHYYVDGP